MTKRSLFNQIAAALFIILSTSTNLYSQAKEEVYTGWENYKNDVPEWLKDAKFGIYFHWGVYNVAAYNSEWFSRSMYVPDTKPYLYQKEKHGSLKQFGYKDYIPMFTAKYFNANKWVDLFVKAGAKFAGPVAEHADGFSMWDSKVNPWNAKNMGPQKDIVGEMQKAIRKRNLKFITTFHHQWQWGWYPTFDTSVDAGDTAYADLYGPKVSVAAWQQKDSAERPNEAFNKRWLAKVEEVVQKYQPDMLYFDSRLNHIGQEYRKQVVTTFFNTPPKKETKVILYKAKELPEGVGMRTHEKTRLAEMSAKTWLTEEPISTYSWSYTNDITLRSAKDILAGLIDIVSKNGIFLLNICPKADGTIPQDQQDILLTIGRWLNKNGEAIYNTRPWYTYGEGPTLSGDDKADVDNRRKYFQIKFTADDIRYTRNGSNLYATLLGKPESGKKVLLTSFNKEAVPQKIAIKNVTVLGSNEKINWEHLNSGLSVTMPINMTDTMATVLKIETLAPPGTNSTSE